MKRNFFALLFAASAFLIACNNDADGNNKGDTTTTDGTTSNNNANANAVSEDDREFATEAASGGMAEVELANLALQNASHARVKAFANMMIRDHGKANDELKSIAASAGLTLPAAPMQEHADHKNELANKKGKEFDKAYMDMMVSDHDKTEDVFQKGSNSNHAGLKGFADRTLPVVKMHLDSAKAIKDALN